MPRKIKTHKPFHRNKKSNSGSSNIAGKYSHLYNNNRWKLIRENQLKKEPLCRICKNNDIIKSATICDHIKPHKGNLIKFWNGPFQSLCKQCHDSVKQAFEKSGKIQRTIGVDGYPIGTSNKK